MPEVIENTDTVAVQPSPRTNWLVRLLKWAGWTVAGLVALCVLAVVMVYLPPVQRWAVNRAGEWLSEEMGMDVTVGHVRLRPPLDLEMGDVLAVQDGDTLLQCGSLDASVRLWPLLRGEVEVDGVSLDEVRLNTLEMVDAAQVSGNVGHLELDSHSIRLRDGVARLNHVLMQDADLLVTLRDSVPEDTTESEPLAWNLLMEDVRLERGRVRVAQESGGDSISAAWQEISLQGSVDLLNSVYNLRNVKISSADVAYGDIALDSLNLEVAQVRMDSLRVDIPEARLTTTGSDVKLSLGMDFSAFDETDPGTLQATVAGHLGMDDIRAAGNPFAADMLVMLPDKPVSIGLAVDGNMQRLQLKQANMEMEGVLNASLGGTLENLTDTTAHGMKADLDFEADLHDLAFVKSYLPKETRNAFYLPRDMHLVGTASMDGGQLSTNSALTVRTGCTGTQSRHNIRLLADVDMDKETYDLDLDVNRLNVNQFVPFDEDLNVTGSIQARGRGFDPFARGTWADASMDFQQANFGKINFSNSQGQLSLHQGNLSLDFDCDNPLLDVSALLAGKLKKDDVDLHADLDIGHADLLALGLSDDVMTVGSTAGVLNLKTTQKTLESGELKNFTLTADIDRLDVLIGENRLKTNHFNLFAETYNDTTSATMSTGDLFFDFHAPVSLKRLMAQGTKLGETAKKQIDDRAIDPNTLKALLPYSTLKAQAGMNNPVAELLSMKGISWDKLHANLVTTPETGVLGDFYVYQLRSDSINIDTVMFDVAQDSTQFVFRTTVSTGDQKSFPGFTAHLNGYASTTDADMRLDFFNLRREQGIDLGLHAIVGDSALHVRLYPEQPVLAFTKFKINPDNFIRLERKNRMFCNIDLKSTEDDSHINLTANPADSLRQDIRAIVENLNIAPLLALVPDAPKMSGKLNIDANYEQDAHRFWVRGKTDIERFHYDGTYIGNVGAVFDYDPLGTDTHYVLATVSHNENDVATVAGTYDSSGDGSIDAKIKLTDLPLSMAAPFIPDQIVVLDGTMGGELTVRGPTDKLDINGSLLPNGMRANSSMYGLKLRFADEPINIDNSRITFDRYTIHGTGETPLTLNGWVDFADTDNLQMALSLYGKNFLLVDSERTRGSVVFGKMYGDFFTRVNGSLNDLRVRGLVNVLSNTDLTYLMADTPLTIDSRLDDIVTFVDFTAPPDIDENRPKRQFLGIDMQLNLQVQDGARLHSEFSADRQSYVDVEGGGALLLTYTPEGVLSLTGRYTVNEGEMKYTLPVIPLKTFTLQKGSYVEFTGEPMNPTLNIAATEQTRATVSDGGSASRSVLFDTGLRVTGTLEDMELIFTIEAPEDLAIQNELASMSKEEKNKLAVAMLTTGMYLSSTNSSGFSANNALNNFLQNEINNIAGKAFSSSEVDVNVGMEQSARDDGTTRTDYSFKFSKRFFSNRLNVVIGGKVNADGNTQENESDAYIDNVSLEWRLDKGGTRYIRIYHEKNYDNLVEGELIENGASLVLKKKVDRLSDLLIWKQKK